MKKIYQPHQVIDKDNYQAIYFVKGKVVVATIDPQQESPDSLIIYDSISDYERENKDQLIMHIQLDVEDVDISPEEFEHLVNEIHQLKAYMERKGVNGTKDKPYVRQELNNIIDRLSKEGYLRQNVAEEITYTLSIVNKG